MEAIYNEKNFQKVLKDRNELFKRICNKYHFTDITDICIDNKTSKLYIVDSTDTNENMINIGKLVNIHGIYGSLVNTYGYHSNREKIFVNVASDIINDKDDNRIYFEGINTYTSYEEACEQIEKILKKYKMLQITKKQHEIEQDFQ